MKNLFLNLGKSDKLTFEISNSVNKSQANFFLQKLRVLATGGNRMVQREQAEIRIPSFDQSWCKENKFIGYENN